MVAIAGDDAVLADLERRLQPDRDRFLADIEVAEAADQAEAVELAGALLEAADEQHLLVEFEQLVLDGLVALRLGRALAVAASAGAGGAAAASSSAARFGVAALATLPALSVLSHGWRLYGGKRRERATGAGVREADAVSGSAARRRRRAAGGGPSSGMITSSGRTSPSSLADHLVGEIGIGMARIEQLRRDGRAGRALASSRASSTPRSALARR